MLEAKDLFFKKMEQDSRHETIRTTRMQAYSAFQNIFKNQRFEIPLSAGLKPSNLQMCLKTKLSYVFSWDDLRHNPEG